MVTHCQAGGCYGNGGILGRSLSGYVANHKAMDNIVSESFVLI